MRRRRLVRVGVAFGLLLVAQAFALLVYRHMDERRGRENQTLPPYEELRSGLEAPDLELERPDGSVVRLTQLRGTPVLLHFWATWCPPCREELPALLACVRELGRGRNVQLLAVSVDRDWTPVRGFFGGEVPPEVVRDRTSTGYQRYEVSLLPDTYLVTADGRLTIRFGGARDWRSREYRELLASLF